MRAGMDLLRPKRRLSNHAVRRDGSAAAPGRAGATAVRAVFCFVLALLVGALVAVARRAQRSKPLRTECDAGTHLMRFILPAAFTLVAPGVQKHLKHNAGGRVDPTQRRVIRFAPNVTTLVLDVGAKASLAFQRSARAFERGMLGDPAVAVVAFEPLVENIGWLQRNWWRLPEDVRRRRHVVPVAAGAADGVAPFHVSRAPACGSTLATSPKNRAACHESRAAVDVPVVALATFFDFVDAKLLARGHHVLKVDAEGADLDVLRGAGAANLRRYFRVVAIECMVGDGAAHHVGECRVRDALAFMADAFPHHKWVAQGSAAANVFWGRTAEDLAWASSALLPLLDA